MLCYHFVFIIRETMVKATTAANIHVKIMVILSYVFIISLFLN